MTYSRGFKQSHLNFVDGLPLLQILAPHSDPSLVVPLAPALLAQTLRLEAGECLVVRDGHSVSRHGGEQKRTGGLTDS